MRSLLAGFRRLLFWSHLAIGIGAGLVILLMSLTGVLLGFERQVIALVDGAPRVSVPPAAARLPVDALLGTASLERETIASVALRAAPEEPVVVRFRERDRAPLLLDPYRGAVVAPPTDSTARKAMASLRRWHRWVGAEGADLRQRLKAVTGAANLAFLGLVLSGLWLWWPRRLTWSAVRQGLWFRRGLAPKARDFNWHNTIGFWTAVPLFFVVASGVFISYRWPGLWLDRIAGSAEERAAAVVALAGVAARGGSAPSADRPAAGVPSASVPGAGREGSAPSPEPAAIVSLDALIEAVTSTVPSWQSLTLTLPGPGDRVLTAAVAEGNTYRPDLRTTLQFDGHDGTLLASSDYAALSPSRKIRAWVRFGHTGEVFGLPGQFIASLASLGGVFLVWTGIALSLRRFLAWWRRRRPLPVDVSGTSRPARLAPR